MKDIKDYLHLYVGCTLRCDTGFVILMSVIPEIIPHTSFGIAVINGSESYRTNLGDYKPVLRPLSDMTEEECNLLGWDYKYQGKIISHRAENLSPEEVRILLKQGFDLFNLIESGLSIDKTKIK